VIGDVDSVAEKPVAAIGATKPAHVCFPVEVSNPPDEAAMRSMELMMGGVAPRTRGGPRSRRRPGTRPAAIA
jgi:hypothetical protein